MSEFIWYNNFVLVLNIGLVIVLIVLVIWLIRHHH